MAATSTSVNLESPVARLIASLADNKYFLGQRYAEWCTAAPTLESAVAAASMAQDEIGHARSFYPLLRDVAGDSPETDAMTRKHFCNVAFLNEAFHGWSNFVAANFLFDTAITTLLRSARDSSLAGLAQRSRRIMEEEPLHWLHGEGWTLRLGKAGGAVRADLQEALAPVYADSVAWFDLATPDLMRERVLTEPPEELRAEFRDRLQPVLDEAGIQL